MGYILSGDEKIDGELDLGIELRRESLYLMPPEGQRHAFAYGEDESSQASTIEFSYAFLRQVVRWATSPQGRRLLAERGVEVDW